MNPNELQDLVEMQRQMMALARHSEFFACTTYMAILICAVFSILIFWKLCQIKGLLERPQNLSVPVTTTARVATPAVTPSRSDDSRYMPKK